MTKAEIIAELANAAISPEAMAAISEAAELLGLDMAIELYERVITDVQHNRIGDQGEYLTRLADEYRDRTLRSTATPPDEP